MDYQNIFKRYEIKYLLNEDQRNALLRRMEGRMKIDVYGHTVIRNIYFDTDNYRLIRTSLDKPVYKEKLRIRSYKKIEGNEDVFVELKKKYESVVYKRRIALPEETAMDWLEGSGRKPGDSQIEKEIDYFRDFYTGLKPKVFISYEREAFYPLDGTDTRITLDSNVLGRETSLSLKKGVFGAPVLDTGLSILEVKVSAGLPMWIIRFLREEGIHKASFSKYGKYYEDYIAGNNTDTKERIKYA
ncbi:MAG: polyphosphate polymerase domain-containing protein [Lachnospiraceae bacterium]|nr:polyphosphate polymerase domain-containing protein [Lachnospiraceae bacterium]